MARRVVPLIIAAYLTLVFIDRFVLLELLVRRIGLAFVLAIAAAAACTGAGFLARRGARGLATNFAVGYPIFGAVCFIVGVVKISAWTMVPLLLIFGGVGVYSMLRGAPAIPPATSETAGRNAGATLALVIVLLCGFAIAQSPPASLDELSYHLAIPWTWAKEGRAIELPLLSHSYFPLGVESADLPFFATLGIDGGTASHFLHLLIAAATMALLFRGDMLLVAAIATAPVLAVTAGWSLVDWNLLAIALVLLRATDEDDRPTANAALAAGLLTKYTFIPLAVIIIGVALWKRRTWALPWMGAIGGSVFFIRNAIISGDPFAPFFSKIAPHVTEYRAGAYLSDYVFDGRFLDESFGASLLSAASATVGLTSFYLIAAGLLLFFLAPSARILVPFFALPASRASMSWKPLRVFVAVGIVTQLVLLVYVVHRVDVMSLVSGDRSDEEYVAKARPTYTTINAIDAVVPADARLLVVGLNETYWFRRRVRGGGNFDGPRVSQYLETPTPEALRERLRADGITHVAVVSAPPPTTVERKREERETVLTAEAQRNLALTLDRYAGNVTQAGSAAVFTLK